MGKITRSFVVRENSLNFSSWRPLSLDLLMSPSHWGASQMRFFSSSILAKAPKLDWLHCPAAGTIAFSSQESLPT
jgi:hypothetical protein